VSRRTARDSRDQERDEEERAPAALHLCPSHRVIGSSGHRRSGHRVIEPSGHFNDRAIRSSSHSVVQPLMKPFDPQADDSITGSPDGPIINWLDDPMARWLDGQMTRWLDGSMARWLDGSMAR